MVGLSRLLHDLPWAIPGVVLALAVAAAVARPVGRRLGEPAFTAWLLVASVGMIAAMTMTPSLELPSVAGCDLRVSIITPETLVTLNDRSLNVLLFFPLGLAIAALRPRHRGAWLSFAILLPPAIELTQLLVTPLSRACQAGDLVDNWLGLLIGLIVGTAAAWAANRIATRRHDR